MSENKRFASLQTAGSSNSVSTAFSASETGALYNTFSGSSYTARGEGFFHKEINEGTSGGLSRPGSTRRIRSLRTPDGVVKKVSLDVYKKQEGEISVFLLYS